VSPPLTRDEVLAIAALAHLTLTDREVELFAGQLAGILAWVNDVRQADTANVPPTSHPLLTATSWRDDERRPSLDRADALRDAPDADRIAGLVRVPKVL
jgi:aspartyl-tRNA(Asn)/glutamyl-tRNA(Gln) amidotransferase subunit C